MKKHDIIVFGNGVSRTAFDLPKLHTKFRTIGCNAIYRDFAPDVVVATDVHITAEIVHSGYSMKHRCFFRDWIPHPAKFKDIITTGFDTVTDFHTNQPFIIATGLTDISPTFDPLTSEIVVFGVHDDDKSRDLKDIGCDRENVETMEFVGPNAVDVATKLFAPDHVYLIGFDFEMAGKEKINNVYAGTPNYRYADMAENERMNQSIRELHRVMKENPNVLFHHVNEYDNTPENLYLPNFLPCDKVAFFADFDDRPTVARA